MAEIHSNWCQSGDMQQEILIVRNVSIYFTRGYITEVLHGQRMFNPTARSSGLQELSFEWSAVAYEDGAWQFFNELD